MKVLRVVRTIGLALLVLSAAAIEITQPTSDAGSSPRAQEPQLVIKSPLRSVMVLLLVILGGGLLFVLSGVYPLQADRPHFAPVRWLLETGKTRSVEFRSRGIQVPNLRDDSLARKGFVLYQMNCRPCHGAPGVAADPIGLGINPKPPQLITTRANWSDAEIYWITSHGLKLSGMPAFAPRLSDTDRWAIVAFLRRLSELSPADYRGLIAAADRGLEPTGWGTDDRDGFAEIKSGNPENGKRLLRQYGCITCHAVPGDTTGDVGPPLTAFAERQYIAGSIVNLPTNTKLWIMNPKRYKPKTAMPALGVMPSESNDIAAYLYTLGSPTRLRRYSE